MSLYFFLSTFAATPIVYDDIFIQLFNESVNQSTIQSISRPIDDRSIDQASKQEASNKESLS